MIPGRPWGFRSEAKRILKVTTMPDVGGKKLAEDLRIKLPDLRKIADGLRLRAAAAVTSFATEAKNVETAIRSIEDEAAEMAKVANEILGNVAPGESGPKSGGESG
jgi:hypothetical protein